MTRKRSSKSPKHDQMEGKSFDGFQLGSVAQNIRKVVHSDLSNHDVECISVVLISHLMLENRINLLIYTWLTGHLPIMGIDKDSKDDVNEIAKLNLRKYVEGMDFIKKVNLIKPLGLLLWPKSSDSFFKDILKINDMRNDIFHRLEFKKYKFGNKTIDTEEGIENFFNLAQQLLINVEDLIELISG